MAKLPGLAESQHATLSDLMQTADRHLALVEQQLGSAYGKVWEGKARMLRRQVRGLQEEVRRRYLEQNLV